MSLLLMRRPHPTSPLSSSSAASDVYKRQVLDSKKQNDFLVEKFNVTKEINSFIKFDETNKLIYIAVSYTHLRAHETGRNLVCRLLLENKSQGACKCA
ncbi:hypothetical protein CDFC105_93850 [Clostridioides difficile]|nr:hypothetical protein CDFC105_93850 [Clostridioides difficile]